MAKEILTQNNYHILLCEDDQINQKVLSYLLKIFDKNCKLDITNNGKECLLKFTQNHYDAIILDIGLPDISGKDVAHSIREKNKDIPIIAYTSQDKYSAKTPDFNDVMMKPINIQVVTEIFNKYLHNSKRLEKGGECGNRIFTRNKIPNKS